VVSLSNVGSRQVQDIRRVLAKRKALLVIGKNVKIYLSVDLGLESHCH
jgi:ribosomal protein L10